MCQSSMSRRTLLAIARMTNDAQKKAKFEELIVLNGLTQGGAAFGVASQQDQPASVTAACFADGTWWRWPGRPSVDGAPNSTMFICSTPIARFAAVR
jgi:hypothetical protein